MKQRKYTFLTNFTALKQPWLIFEILCTFEYQKLDQHLQAGLPGPNYTLSLLALHKAHFSQKFKHSKYQKILFVLLTVVRWKIRLGYIKNFLIQVFLRCSDFLPSYFLTLSPTGHPSERHCLPRRMDFCASLWSHFASKQSLASFYFTLNQEDKLVRVLRFLPTLPLL